MKLHKLVELWKANKDHIISESIEGFPSGNVYVGMTAEDYSLFDDIIDELMSESSGFKKPEPIVWHKYPQEKPNRSDHYLVSGVGIVTMYEWSASRESWMNRKSLPISDVGIDAWAELPEPYEEIQK